MTELRNAPAPAGRHADYLAPSEMIDYQHPRVQEFLIADRCGTCDDIATARRLFEFVRDSIAHSWDIQSERVTAKASEALEHREGICYAKTHLLAALLRGSGIPSGICYQRLTLEDTPESGYCVHSLNTVYLESLGRWIRLDARGNKPGVDAQFSLTEERLAFDVRPELGECDYLVNYAEPHPLIVETLMRHDDCRIMYSTGLPASLSLSPAMPLATFR